MGTTFLWFFLTCNKGIQSFFFHYKFHIVLYLSFFIFVISFLYGYWISEKLVMILKYNSLKQCLIIFLKILVQYLTSNYNIEGYKSYINKLVLRCWVSLHFYIKIYPNCFTCYWIYFYWYDPCFLTSKCVIYSIITNIHFLITITLLYVYTYLVFKVSHEIKICLC